MEIINGLIVQGISEIRDTELAKRDSLLTPKDDSAAQQQFTSSLAGHIIRNFFFNRDARRSSGIEDEMFESLRSYNGEYSAQDLALIRRSGGSEIYINIVGVKSRAAASWIRDIQMPAKLEAWSVEPTPVAELPDDIKKKIEDALKVEFGRYVENFQAQPIGLPAPQEQPQQGQAPPQTAPQPQPQPGISPAAEFTPQQGNTSQNSKPLSPAGVAQTIKEFNEAKRDIEDMMLAEINKIATHEMKKMEREIADKLAEGGWTKALSDFIDDFVVFPTAFIKGPIITKDNSLSYSQGQPVVNSRYTFQNKRVSPFDMYPSPNSTTVNDGSNLIEHCRLTRRELLDMRGLPGYKDDAIVKVVGECGTAQASWVDSGLESDKALDERRGSEWEANTEVIHGLHFHGSIPAKVLKEWQMSDPEVHAAVDEEEFEVDAILAHNHVVRCSLNTHPLKRRPYYKASYQTRPGSFWGRSLPSLMSDIQRMCNAAARALANNMGLACLTGDTVVYRTSNNGRSYSEITVLELFNSKGPNRKIRCLDERTGKFYQNKLLDVIYNGNRAVYEIRTKEGYRIKATDNHRFMKDDGSYDFVSNFSPGDMIAVNGQPVPRTKLCIDCGCPITAKAQRCKSCHNKRWNNAQIASSRAEMSCSNTTARQHKECRAAVKDYCERCGAVEVRFEVHHKDRNPRNNTPDNLCNLCCSCHSDDHAREAAAGDPYKNHYLCYDEIISIEYAGQEDVYDLCMQGPDHNFVANGFVSHNSGPQIEIYTDRLADNGKIENIYPFKIWQLTSDPTGAGGRAIQFTQPTSNAAELLKVYQEFEVRADDATGIPRYSYGNERVGGAAMTATGLAMLLESASKAIKDCVRNIDEEVIIPRIEMQFYWTIRTNPLNFYSGDPKVVARGSSSLTMKGAEQMRRNEFLQITANEFDMAVIGKTGRAELLRSVASDLNISEDIIPSRLELRAKEASESQNAAQMQKHNMEMQHLKLTSGIEATKLQIEGQKSMHQQTQQVRLEELGLKERISKIETELKMLNLDSNREAELQRHNSALNQLDFKETKEDERFNTEVALKLQRGEGI